MGKNTDQILMSRHFCGENYLPENFKKLGSFKPYTNNPKHKEIKENT